MKKAKIFLGSPPPKDSNFHQLSTAKFDSVEWSIYEDVESSPKWYFYKIASSKPVKHKANYSIVYSDAEKRLAGKDLVHLAKHRSQLLISFMAKADLRSVKYYGSSFSESISQMIEAEG